MSNQEGSGVWKSLCAGIASLLRTGAWHVQDAADQARTAKVILGEVDEAVEQDAQSTLDNVDNALTAYNVLKAKVAREQANHDNWQSRAESMAQKAKALPAGDERTKLEGLVKDALQNVVQSESMLQPLETELAAAQPEVEDALKMVEQVGLNRETALATHQRLDVSLATAEAKKALAMAHRNGTSSKVADMLNEATGKVERIQAEAASSEMITSRLPKTAVQVESEVARITRDDAIKDRFAALMADAPTEPPAAADGS